MNILLIIGLPGSGKSHLCNKLRGGHFNVLDDIEILDGLPSPDDKRVLVIASPNYCYPDILKKCKEHLRQKYVNCSITCLYFENDAAKCLRNVEYRNDGREVERSIELMSKYYEIPDTVTPLKIWQYNGE